MGRAFFRITNEMLLERFNLPPGTRILGAGGDRLWCAFTVEHPDLPEVAAGEPLPEVNPMFRRQDPEVFVEWRKL